MEDNKEAQLNKILRHSILIPLIQVGWGHEQREVKRRLGLEDGNELDGIETKKANFFGWLEGMGG